MKTRGIIFKMTCKDCVHEEICNYLEATAYSADQEELDCHICKYFKNKTTFTEVPYTIGQQVWVLHGYWYRSTPEIIESKVSMLQQKVDKSWRIRVSNKYGTTDFKADEISKYVFPTKEAAEFAVKVIPVENT